MIRPSEDAVWAMKGAALIVLVLTAWIAGVLGAYGLGYLIAGKWCGTGFGFAYLMLSFGFVAFMELRL